MSDYWKSYRARLQRNNDDLYGLAKAVKEKDSEVEVYIDRSENKFLSGVVFFKGEQINSIQFIEVPYRWSGCGVKAHYGFLTDDGTKDDNCKMPFTVDDVLNNFKPVTDVLFRQPRDYFKSKDHYLKWHCWLKTHE